MQGLSTKASIRHMPFTKTSTNRQQNAKGCFGELCTKMAFCLPQSLIGLYEAIVGFQATVRLTHPGLLTKRFVCRSLQNHLLRFTLIVFTVFVALCFIPQKLA